jgi:hypothetical protein
MEDFLISSSSIEEPLNLDPIKPAERKIHPSTPLELERITCWNTSAIKYVVYEDKNSNLFLEWWTQLSWKEKYPERNFLWSLQNKKSGIWKYYRPICRIDTGTPSIQCLRCEACLQHPGIAHIGTTPMIRHIQTSTCKARSKQRGWATLDNFIQKGKNVQVTNV